MTERRRHGLRRVIMQPLSVSLSGLRVAGTLVGPLAAHAYRRNTWVGDCQAQPFDRRAGNDPSRARSYPECWACCYRAATHDFSAPAGWAALDGPVAGPGPQLGDPARWRRGQAEVPDRVMMLAKRGWCAGRQHTDRTGLRPRPDPAPEAGHRARPDSGGSVRFAHVEAGSLSVTKSL